MKMQAKLAVGSCEEHIKCVDHMKHFARPNLTSYWEGSENVNNFLAHYGLDSLTSWASSVRELCSRYEAETGLKLETLTQGGHKILPEHISDRYAALFNGASSGGTGAGAFGGSQQRCAKTGTNREVCVPPSVAVRS